MVSTAITRLFPLPNSPSGSASVDVNTETGYKFIDAVREYGTAPSALLVARSATRPRGCAPRDARTTSGRAQGVAPPQDSPQAAIEIGLWGVFGKILRQIVDHGSFLPDRSNLFPPLSWIHSRTKRVTRRGLGVPNHSPARLSRSRRSFGSRRRAVRRSGTGWV